jgi:predicted component of type VI protein secretion system
MTTETELGTFTAGEVETMLEELTELHEARLARAVEAARNDERARLAIAFDSPAVVSAWQAAKLVALGLALGVLAAFGFAP